MRTSAVAAANARIDLFKNALFEFLKVH